MFSPPKLIVYLQFLVMSAVFLAPWVQPGLTSSYGVGKHWWQLVGIILILMGIFLVGASVWRMKSNLVVRPQPKNNGELVADWPFSMVRNPIYLGGMILNMGWVLIMESWLAAFLVLVLWGVLHKKIVIEEVFLQEKFGKTYLQYQTQTPRWIPKWLIKG